MPIMKHQVTKTLSIRVNGRSADFITPNFIYGCAGGCRNSYCYVMRYNFSHLYINDNLEQILQTIGNHAAKLAFPKPSNQTDPIYWTYDIGCSTDVCLHWKHYPWLNVFDYFHEHPKIKATFATKYVNLALLHYNPQQKVRIRFSLMPQTISTILEPHTSSIDARIQAIHRFLEAGYDVHLNFSPIIVYDHWLKDYQALFNAIDTTVPENLKPRVQAEAIFLTHNLWQHERNLKNAHVESESFLWQPLIQESKKSQYGSEAVRYRHPLKLRYSQAWTALHQEMIPWNTLRYIF